MTTAREDQFFARAMHIPLRRAELWTPVLMPVMQLADISTDLRVAHFLAQVGHESMGLVFTREVWGPTPAQRGYEMRADLGNTQPGDGRRYMGHGLIQITGRGNHAKVTQWMRSMVTHELPDFEAYPDRLSTNRYYAALSAAAYWKFRGLNKFADAHDLLGATRRINGGINGLPDRRLRLGFALRAITDMRG